METTEKTETTETPVRTDTGKEILHDSAHGSLVAYEP